MWNNLLKLGLVSYIWKRYRRTLIALPLLLFYFYLLNLIHGDIITYAQLQGDTTWLAWTFLLKWLLICVGVAVFIYIHLSAKSDGVDSGVDSLLQRFQDKGEVNEEQHESVQNRDAFAAIRNKKTLRSKADLVLQKNKDR